MVFENIKEARFLLFLILYTRKRKNIHFTHHDFKRVTNLTRTQYFQAMKIGVEISNKKNIGKFIYDHGGFISGDVSGKYYRKLSKIKNLLNNDLIEKMFVLKSVLPMNIFLFLLLNYSKSIKIPFTQLKNELNINHDRYNNINDFKKRVLNSAKEQLKKYLDFDFDYIISRETRYKYIIEFIV